MAFISGNCTPAHQRPEDVSTSSHLSESSVLASCSHSNLGGIVTTVCFFFNHGEVSVYPSVRQVCFDFNGARLGLKCVRVTRKELLKSRGQSMGAERSLHLLLACFQSCAPPTHHIFTHPHPPPPPPPHSFRTKRGFSFFFSGSIRQHFNYSPLLSGLSNTGALLSTVAAEELRGLMRRILSTYFVC